MKLYHYPNCSSCKKALAFVKKHSLEVELIHIVDQPPTLEELQQMLEAQQDRKKLFNSSGFQYRELDMKTKLPNMSDEEAMKVLATNGMLIKRPFFLGEGVALVGFKEDLWLQELEG